MPNSCSQSLKNEAKEGNKGKIEREEEKGQTTYDKERKKEKDRRNKININWGIGRLNVLLEREKGKERT